MEPSGALHPLTPWLSEPWAQFLLWSGPHPCLAFQSSMCWEPGLGLWGLPALVGHQYVLGSPHWPPGAV